MADQLQIGFVLFPTRYPARLHRAAAGGVARPDAKVHLIWKRIEPVASDTALTLNPTTTFADCPQLDVICVPGGVGTDDMVNDEEMLAFLRQQAEGQNTSRRCARAPWCSARPACSTAIAPRRIGARSTISPNSARRGRDTGVRRPQPYYRRRCHRRHRLRSDARLDADRPQTAEMIQLTLDIIRRPRSMPARPRRPRRKSLP